MVCAALVLLTCCTGTGILFPGVWGSVTLPLVLWARDASLDPRARIPINRDAFHYQRSSRLGLFFSEGYKFSVEGGGGGGGGQGVVCLYFSRVM